MNKPKQPLSRMLSDYQPQPGKTFYQRMENAPWNRKGKPMPHPIHRPARFAWKFAIAAILVLVTLSLSIPSVRAALSTWLGLSVAPSNQMPAAAVTLVGVTPVTPTPTAQTIGTPTSLPTFTQPGATATSPTAETPTKAGEKPAEIAQMSAQAGWEVFAPMQLPKDYHLESTYYDTNHRMVILSYLATKPLPGATDPSLTATKTITLLQAQANDFVPMQLAPDSKIEDIQVNSQPGIYTIGAWDSQFVKDDKDPNGGKMVSTWRNDLPIQNLYWQVGKVYLVLVTDDESLIKQELIDLAASMKQ